MSSDREPPESGAHLGDSLSAWLDGELAPAARREAANHLDACPTCRAELDLVAGARAAVRSLGVRTLPAGFLDEWAPAVRRLRPRRIAWGLAATAAAAVAVFLPREPSVSPPLPALVDSHAARASVTGDPVSHLAPIAVPVSFGP